MEAKKNPRVYLENKKALFFLIGLMVPVSIILFAFEMKDFDESSNAFQTTVAATEFVEEVMQTEQQQQQQPPPPQQVTSVIEIVDDDEEILDELDLNIEADAETILDDFEFQQEEEMEEEEEEIFLVVEESASFPGGDAARIQFLAENLVYPEHAKEAAIEGTVFIQFVVEKDGRITRIQAANELGGGCEEEAIRVVKKMPRWKPAKQRGRAVRSRFVLPITFQLAN